MQQVDLSDDVDDRFDRVSLIIIHARKMLFVCSRDGDVFFDPGGRRYAGIPDEELLLRKMKYDLGVDLVIPLTLMTSYAAPAYDKPGETMVQQHCYMLNQSQPALDLSKAIKKTEWANSATKITLASAAEGIRQRMHEEGLID